MSEQNTLYLMERLFPRMVFWSSHAMHACIRSKWNEINLVIPVHQSDGIFNIFFLFFS